MSSDQAPTPQTTEPQDSSVGSEGRGRRQPTGGDEPTTVTPDTQGLINPAEDFELSSEDEDSDDDTTWSRRRQTQRYQRAEWWFLEPAVKRNWVVVTGAWFMIFLAIGCIITGIALEILYHAASLDVVRGFIFFFIAFILLVPSVYAVTHVYLAARRVGRIRFSSVWFFRN